MQIRVKFLGEPQIYIDDQLLEVPQKKVLALFLLLLFHGRSTREELTSKLWSDYPPESAKRNLRNGLYNLKSAVGKDVIVTTGNTYVLINPAISVTRDIDVFVTENNELLLLELADFVFLDKFYLARSPEFEDWQIGIQAIYEKMLRERLETALKASERAGDTDLMERFAQKLLCLEPYHEKAVRSLLWLHLQNKQYHSAILLYKSFESRIQEELGEQPDETLRELYHKALGLDLQGGGNSVSDSAVMDHIWGDNAILMEEYRKFLVDGSGRGCIVCGSTGMGKCETVDSFLKTARIRGAVRIVFGLAQSGVGLWAADALAERLAARAGVADSQQVATPADALGYIQLLRGLLDRCAREEEHLVIVLQQLEYIDADSLPVLLCALFDGERPRAFVTGTYACDLRSDREVPRVLEAQSGLRMLWLREPDEQQAKAYLRENMFDSEEAETVLPAAMAFSQGNRMLLRDFALAGVHSGQDDAILSADSMARLRAVRGHLAEQELRVLECLCVCEDGMECDLIARMTGLEPYRLLDVLDQLQIRGLIAQTRVDHRLMLGVRMGQARGLYYRDLSPVRRAGLHQMAGRLYEEQYLLTPRNYFVISQLKRHYEQTDLEFERLLYTFVELEYVLDYTDEFFPTLKTLDGSNISFYIDRGKLYRQFSEFEKQLGMLDSYIPQDRLNLLKMRFNFLIGRTMNRDGKREQGIVYIRELTRLAETLGRKDYCIKAYLETVYYGLKCDNVDLMSRYVEVLKSVEDIESYEVEYGILFRLEGLIHRNNREYERSAACLHRSIEIFDSPKLRNQNFINIAAAYDYLGLVHRDQMDYAGAERCFLKAIEICREKGIRKSLDLFYEDLGYTMFLTEDYDRAREYLQKSLRLYDEFGTYWLRSIAESCMAMIELRCGNRAAALEHYRRAGIFSRKDSVQEEMAVLEQARRMLQQEKIV